MVNEKKVRYPSLIISYKTAAILAWHRFNNWNIQCEYCWKCTFSTPEMELDDSELSLYVPDYKPAPRLETLQTWLKKKYGVDTELKEKSLYEALLSVTPKKHIDHEVLMRGETVLKF